MTLSPGPMSTCLWVENAMRYRALISSPWEPVVTMTCWFRGSPLMRLMSISVFLGTFMYPNSVETFMMFSMLRPVTATFRPQAAAASSTCWMRCTLLAKVVTMIRLSQPVNCRLNVAPTARSLMV